MMDEKTFQTLEYSKILERLASLAAFAPSAEKARNLRPTNDLEEARIRLAETSEAVNLLVSHSDISIGGARDIRELVDLAEHGGVLSPPDLLDIKYTLVSARNLARTFERMEDQYPVLFDLTAQFPPPLGLIDTISRTISERSEILDTASDKLGNIRRDMRIAHDRLLTKMQRIVSDPNNTPYLQETLITQRDGRYVLPLRAEFKGRIRSVVHDQSTSGATLFVEPLSVVELNNEYRELQLAERDEERRILKGLSSMVGSFAYELIQAVEIIAELDFILVRGKFSEKIAGTEPVLHAFKNPESGKHPGSVIRLYQARHPLLDPKTVVPIDVELDPQTYALVITGPNTGGKTVTLKTVGLIALMAQSGLHIPTQSGSEISIFVNIFADIGDEQSIEQSLSTFSGHITNIIRIMDEADNHSLVILDELGAGTDPQEGAALAQAILSHLLERGITTLVATHYPELKTYAHARPGVINASVEFDVETLRPSYHLTIGLPGRSNALLIADRLGMPEEIIDTARQGFSPDDLRSEDLLDEIHRQRDLSRQARSVAEETRHETEHLRAELIERLDNIEEERRDILENARRDNEAEVEKLREEIQQVKRSLARARQPLDALNTIEEQAEALEETVNEPISLRQPTISASSNKPVSRPVRLGDKVKLRTFNQQGVVTSLGEEEAEVQVGILRVRTRLSDLELSGSMLESTETTAPPVDQTATYKPASPGVELDLRGLRADEALDALDNYLDTAYLSGMPYVRIIHGKGTGKLRQVVRLALSQHAHVKSFEGGGDKEGGEGVTVVKF
ncbi:MAG: endonuclease MutS2 [Anaerolineales bacterium]|nr:endonuclease MutS2 [Anaerolineales bacterium]